MVISSPDFLAFQACSEVSDVTEIVLERALRVARTRMGNVQLVQWRKRPTLEIVEERGFQDEFLTCFRSVSMIDPSTCGRTLVSRDRVVVEDVLEDHAFAPYRDVALRAGFRSVQSTPLMSSGGALYGVLSTHGEAPGRPDDRQLFALRSIATAAADAIASLRAREQRWECDGEAAQASPG